MNKADRDRLSRLHDLSCIACGRFPTEAHHIVNNGYRRLSGGHQATIPLDRWCPRGEPWPGMTVSECQEKIGPSLALSKREFVKYYGNERSLLERTDKLLGNL